MINLIKTLRPIGNTPTGTTLRVKTDDLQASPLVAGTDYSLEGTYFSPIPTSPVPTHTPPAPAPAPATSSDQADVTIVDDNTPPATPSAPDPAPPAGESKAS